MPSPVGNRARVGASWGLAVWPRGRATARSPSASDVMSASAPARLWGTAGAAPRAGLCKRSLCPALAGATGCWAAAQAPGVRPVGAPEAGAAAAGPGGRAGGRARPRPAGAERHGARRQAVASRSGPWWPDRHGAPAERGPARGHKGGQRQRPGQPASPRATDRRRRRPAPVERERGRAARPRAWGAYGAGPGARRAGRACRRTASGRAGRDRSTRGAESCTIAWRAPPTSATGFSPAQHTMAVCWGGGLNKYQGCAVAGKPTIRRRRDFRDLQNPLKRVTLLCIGRYCLTLARSNVFRQERR
jgi:hypothetical protein